MKLLTVREQEAGQRSARYLEKVLPEAGRGFLYRMFRKKNITLNGRKMTGSEILAPGDEIRIFFAEETLEKFTGRAAGAAASPGTGSRAAVPDPDILYEDAHVLIVNKPQGMLTQKAREGDISLNEVILHYLEETGSYQPADAAAFRPAAVNRLDRNTSGIVLAGKSIRGLQVLSALLRGREMEKYYLAVVKGTLAGPLRLDGWLRKDEAENRVEIRKEHFPGADRILTGVKPLRTGGGMTLAEIELITGKTHQIRAHLASIGHPVGGDGKYGNPAFNRKLRESFGVRFQLLHAARIVMPENLPEPLGALSGREFRAPAPDTLSRVIRSMENPA
jgi:23S rRNA pseudouridine955/2504/2580 synthase